MDSEEILAKLNEFKILEQIIKNQDYDDNEDIIEIKIFCISNFEYDSKYNIDFELSLKIQNLYISFFNKYLNNSNSYKLEFIEYLIKIIKNLSLCINDKYINNLLESKIIPFLLNIDKDKNIFTENLLTIIGNMSSISEEEILSKLYKDTIEYLIDIFANYENIKNNNIINLCLWNINNFIDNTNLCFDTFCKKDLITLLENYITKVDVMDEDIFNEICQSYKNLINSIKIKEKYCFLKHYNIISLLIDGFKKIKNFNNLNKIGKIIVALLYTLFTINDKEIANYNKIIFGNKGGKEFIFDRILNIFMEQKYLNENIYDENNINNVNNDDTGDENQLLEIISYIQYKILNNNIDYN